MSKALLGVKSLISQRYFAVLVILVFMIFGFATTQQRFATQGNLEALLTSASILWVVSLGLTFVMLAGGFDLSIGSVLAVCGIALGWFVNHAGLNIYISIVLTLALGAVFGGLVNGLLIGKFGLSFLVVTLGSQILFRGMTDLWSGTKTTQVISPFLDSLAFSKTVGVPNPIWVMAVTFLIMLYVQKSTYFGRDVYAVGGNAEAARLSGIRTPRTIAAVYAISGLMAALGSVLQVARIGASSPQVGESLVFSAAAAVLLGGTSFAGGVGGVGGTFIGVLFLATLQNGLSVTAVPSYWQEIITGLILLTAIGLDLLRRKRTVRVKIKIAIGADAIAEGSTTNG
jgi:ribose transport system permease protein